MADVAANFGLDTTEYKAGIDQVVGLTKQARAEMEESFRGGAHEAEGLGNSIKHVGHEASSSMRAFHHFIAMPSMLAAVAHEARELGSSITEFIIDRFENASEKAEAFMATLAGKDAKEGLKEIDKERKKIADELTSKTTGGRGGADLGWLGALLFGDSPEQLDWKMEALNKRAEELHKITHREEADKEEKKQQEETFKLSIGRDQTRASALVDGPEKIEAEAAVKIAELKHRLSKTENAEQRELIAQTITWEQQKRDLALAELSDKQIREADKARADKERKDREAALNHQKALDRAGIESISASIRTEELSGLTRQAEIDRLRLDMAREMLKIKEDENLTDQEKAAIYGRLRADEQDQESAMLGKFGRDDASHKSKGEVFAGQSLGFGNFQQALGGGVVDVGRQQLDTQKEMSKRLDDNNEVLKQINGTLAAAGLGTWG